MCKSSNLLKKSFVTDKKRIITEIYDIDVGIKDVTDSPNTFRESASFNSCKLKMKGDSRL